MALNIDIPKPETLKPKITIFGVGGAGGNAINNMINSKLEGVEFVAANTDAQALEHSLAENKIQLGETTTKGLGAGSFPDRGRAAAEENIEEIEKLLEGNHMIFIAAGMGGGTGTGAAPVIAKLAKDKDILTVGVVTKPFHFEGKYRMDTAENGIEELKKNVDTLIIIPNQNLFRIANERTTFESAFKMADDVLNAGVRGVTDLITMPGLVNLDFADIRTVMTKMGKAMMGTGEAEGENRAIDACEAAISNPLLDDISIRGAKGVLVNMTGGPDMTLFEADMAVNTIRKEVDDNANIIFGSAFDENMKGKIRVSVVATGIDEEEYRQNIIRETTNNNTSSKFRSIDDNFAVREVEKEGKSFFDPGKTVVPEAKPVAKISNDFQAKSELQEDENPNYGKADKNSSAKQIQSAISQISFFSDDSGADEEEQHDSVKEVKSEKKPAKKKDKDSGFSLFSFMSSSSKEKEVVDDVDLDEEQAKQLEELINSKKPDEDDSSSENDIEETQEDENEEGNDNDKIHQKKESSAKVVDLDEDENDEQEDLPVEVGNDNEKNQEEEKEVKIAEKEVSLDGAEKKSKGNISDDILNVPAFFRRKKS